MNDLQRVKCDTLRNPATIVRLLRSVARWPSNGLSLRFKAIRRLVRVRAGGRGVRG
jgi:hypothetical protein